MKGKEGVGKDTELGLLQILLEVERECGRFRLVIPVITTTMNQRTIMVEVGMTGDNTHHLPKRNDRRKNMTTMMRNTRHGAAKTKSVTDGRLKM